MAYYYPNTIFITLFILQASIFFSLIYFLVYSIKSIRDVPKLAPLKNSPSNLHFPMISIILPSRNEEKYIEKCLDSLLEQNYSNYEIIAINDSSADNTGEIIKRYSKIHCKIIHVESQSKPEGWTGKNWACYQGYLQSKGELFLFTDADTTHSTSSIFLAVTYLMSEQLDTLTAIPKILAYDFWTKITLPILWTFSVARFSALKANNPKTKVGYFFGSFFIITRKAYETIGTHKSVKEEIVEDAELGRRVKEQGFSLKVVHGEKHIKAVWARDTSTLWHGLRRLLIPLYEKEKIKAYIMVIATFVLLLLPLIILPFSIIIVIGGKGVTNDLIILFLSITSILLLVTNNVLQLKYTVFQNPWYALAFPLAGSFVLVAFLSSIIQSKQKNVINWRDRKYSIREEK
jgi:cellulose synthase/poly-beta-1,6-N-acetylglucosamine synthase-like glycosyltransferase